MPCYFFGFSNSLYRNYTSWQHRRNIERSQDSKNCPSPSLSGRVSRCRRAFCQDFCPRNSAHLAEVCRSCTLCSGYPSLLHNMHTHDLGTPPAACIPRLQTMVRLPAPLVKHYAPPSPCSMNAAKHQQEQCQHKQYHFFGYQVDS